MLTKLGERKAVVLLCLFLFNCLFTPFPNLCVTHTCSAGYICWDMASVCCNSVDSFCQYHRKVSSPQASLCLKHEW